MIQQWTPDSDGGGKGAQHKRLELSRFRGVVELWVPPQEMAHFAECVRGKAKPQATGEVGLVVMQALCAAYASAGEGRKIQMPFSAKGVQKPIDLWFQGPQYRSRQPRK